MRFILVLLAIHSALPFYNYFKIQHNTQLTALRKPSQKNYDDMDVFERFEKHSQEQDLGKQYEYLWKIYYKINNITESTDILN